MGGRRLRRRLLSPSSRGARTTFGPADALLPGAKYGLGLIALGGWRFHGGEIFGWETQVMANPATGQVVVADANSCCGNAIRL